MIEFFKSRVGIVIISIVWGLGLATLFKRSCEGKDCKVIEYHGPPIKDVEHHWQYDGDTKCYRWVPYVTKCN